MRLDNGNWRNKKKGQGSVDGGRIGILHRARVAWGESGARDNKHENEA